MCVPRWSSFVKERLAQGAGALAFEPELLDSSVALGGFSSTTCSSGPCFSPTLA